MSIRPPGRRRWSSGTCSLFAAAALCFSLLAASSAAAAAPDIIQNEGRQLSQASPTSCRARFGRHCRRCTTQRGRTARRCTAVDFPKLFTLKSGRVVARAGVELSKNSQEGARKCRRGFRKSKAGNFKCLPCKGATYQPSLGKTACLTCKAPGRVNAAKTTCSSRPTKRPSGKPSRKLMKKPTKRPSKMPTRSKTPTPVPTSAPAGPTAAPSGSSSSGEAAFLGPGSNAEATIAPDIVPAGGSTAQPAIKLTLQAGTATGATAAGTTVLAIGVTISSAGLLRITGANAQLQVAPMLAGAAQARVKSASLSFTAAKGASGRRLAQACSVTSLVVTITAYQDYASCAAFTAAVTAQLNPTAGAAAAASCASEKGAIRKVVATADVAVPFGGSIVFQNALFTFFTSLDVASNPACGSATITGLTLDVESGAAALPSAVISGLATTAPTVAPTAAPTAASTTAPTAMPTTAPTSAPTIATTAPTAMPTPSTTAAPTDSPTSAPSAATPTAVPSATDPPITEGPTSAPTSLPMLPTVGPSNLPRAPPPGTPSRCLPGFGLNAAARTCTKCRAGTASDGTTPCISCGLTNQTTFFATGAFKCQDCEVCGAPFGNGVCQAFGGCSACDAGYYTSEQGRCIRCKENEYNPTPGASSCLPCGDKCVDCDLYTGTCATCESGYGLNATDNTCSRCPEGQYAPGGGNIGGSMCRACDEQCIVCNAEDGCDRCTDGWQTKYSGEGTNICEKCPPGRTSVGYSCTDEVCTDRLGNLICDDECCKSETGCPAEHTTCDRCRAGYFNTPSFPAGNTTYTCQACPVGTYRLPGNDTSNTMCTTCDERCLPGSCRKSKGCVQCEPGYGPEGGKCIKCDAMSSSDGVASCMACPSGTAPSLNGSACADCGFNQTSDGFTCVNCSMACANGLPCDATNGICGTCPAGQALLGSPPTCSECPAGTFNAHGSAGCFHCPAGTSSASGSTKCTPLPRRCVGIDAAGSCVQCKPGFGSSSNGTCTECLEGTFSSNGTAGCVACPAAPGCTSCNPKNGFCDVCEPGYALPEEGSSPNSPPTCTACPPGQASPDGDYCEYCDYEEEPSYTIIPASPKCLLCDPKCSDGSCSPSRGCLHCQNGYHMDGNGGCIRCAPGEYTPPEADGKCMPFQGTCAYPLDPGRGCPPCAPGTEPDGNDGCTTCAPGLFSTGFECTDCGEVGGFSMLPSASECTPLGPHCQRDYNGNRDRDGNYPFYASRTKGCTKCDQDFIPVNGTCTSCPINATTFFPYTEKVCTDCGPQCLGECNNGECRGPCEPGYAVDYVESAISTCKICPAGAASPLPDDEDNGTSPCVSCKEEHGFSLVEGSTKCTSCQGCQPGNCSPTGGCDSCQAGWVPDPATPGACVQCDAGTFKPMAGNNGTCTPCNCAFGRMCDPAAGCSSCPPGQEPMGVNATSCQACLPGTASAFGTSCQDCSTLDKGFSTVTGASTCSSCDACLYIGSDSVDYLTSEPGCGATSPCSRCIDGYELTGAGTCRKCADGEFANSYYENDKCTPCDENCEFCYPNYGCERCAYGYEPKAGLCVAFEG